MKIWQEQSKAEWIKEIHEKLPAGPYKPPNLSRLSRRELYLLLKAIESFELDIRCRTEAIVEARCL